jgi:hypothetical protein
MTIPTHVVRLFPVLSLTLESRYSGQPDTDWDRYVYIQRMGPSAKSLNSGRSSHPTSATLTHLSTPLAECPTPHEEPNAISHFTRRRQKSSKSLTFNETLCGIWCVSNIACRPIWCLYIYCHPSSISRCSCLTAVRCECLPTRHTSPFTLHADYIR